MSPTGSLASLSDACALLEQALNSKRGIRLVFSDRKSAVAFRARLYSARLKDREQNEALYGPDEPMHGKSQWDGLFISLDKEDRDTEFTVWHLTIARRSADAIGGLVCVEDL